MNIERVSNNTINENASPMPFYEVSWCYAYGYRAFHCWNDFTM